MAMAVTTSCGATTSGRSQLAGQASGGFTDNGANAFTSAPTTWHVAGIGDFNGDGRDDILWRNDAGQLTNWLGTPTAALPTMTPTPSVAPTDWHVAGTGDFNGDGRDDILWRNDNGQLTNWLGQANGGFVANDANALSTCRHSWHVAGTGDFNGDGRDDILWRNDNGPLTNWLGQANGGFTDNDANASPRRRNWHVAGHRRLQRRAATTSCGARHDGRLTNWLGTASGRLHQPTTPTPSPTSPTAWHVQDPDIFWL